jgi:hypothetical protein
MSRFQDDCIARLNEQVKQDQIIIKKLSDQRDELVTALERISKMPSGGGCLTDLAHIELIANRAIQKARTA